MLAPKISLKQLLLGTAAVAFFLALTSLAYRGSFVALGLVIAVLALPALFGLYALVYVVLVQVSRILERRKSRFVSPSIGSEAVSSPSNQQTTQRPNQRFEKESQ